MTRPRFAFLLLREHPYGREMLGQLLAAGFAPVVIVEEDSEVADEEREKFLTRIGARPVGAEIAAQAADHEIPVVRVAKHDSPSLMAVLGDIELDLIVLGGTRVIRGPVLAHPRHGVLNSHPGLLPDCRGSASPAWSVIHDIPIGATTHFCDEDIDTGDVLLRRTLPVHRGDTYEDLCHGTLVLAGELMADALTAYAEDRWAELRRPQGEARYGTFKNAPEEVLARVREKLASETYAHYEEQP
jgi:methionyl-tRNA formyltransferase